MNITTYYMKRIEMETNSSQTGNDKYLDENCKQASPTAKTGELEQKSKEVMGADE